jgi:outer membrane protein assembly factor BamB
VELGGTIEATPLVESQTVFVPTGNVLYAVAISNRSVRWSFEAVGDLRASPVLLDNLVYIGSEDKRVYALDKYTGDLAWSLKLDDVVAASPSIDGLTLVVGTESGMVFGIHSLQGEELWRHELGSPVSTAACIGRHTAMIGTSGSNGGRLYGLDVDEGEELWVYPPKGTPALDPILTTPVTSSGLVYFGSDSLYCLEVVTGAEVWSFETGDSVRGSPAIVDTYLVFGCYDGLVRCIDKTTANVVWQFESQTVFRSGTCIDYDKAYIGGRDGVLYARSVLNRQAPTVSGPYTLEAEAHDSVEFSVVAQDPEGNQLSYAWDFGDGNKSTERSPLHEYPVAGTYTVTVTVSDGSMTKKHSITVTVHPFETKVTGGDTEGVSVAVVGGAAGAVVAVVVVVLLLLLRRRGGGARTVSDVMAPGDVEKVEEFDAVTEAGPILAEGPDQWQEDPDEEMMP